MDKAAAPGTDVQTLVDAVRTGKADEVQVLVESDPSLAEARDSAGVSALVLALYHGHPDIARWLAARRTDLDIFEAAALGDRERVADLLRRQPTLASAFSPDGFTALALASFLGHLEVVRLLVALGADVNAAGQGEAKYTALSGAVTARHADIVAELIRNGANVRHTYGPGYTPLHVAAANGSSEIVRMLLEAGADPAARTDDGRTPADFARHLGHEDIAAILEEK